jgi:hypothetical protein
MDYMYSITPACKIAKPSLIRKIKLHADASVYRLNSKTTDCYAFSLIDSNDWEGGWDWQNSLVDTSAEYILSFKDNKFYQIIRGN